MRDDDDVLADYDLDSWEVPPPPAGLVDAVIARAKQPAAVGAAEDPSDKPVRRWWIGGVIVAGLAAAGAFVLWGTQRAPKDGGGDVVATRAQLVELGPSRAQLDPGAELHWRRDKHRLTATQPRGTASWTVHGDDTLVIDAGAMVASVEASGASLRVEVKMNISDSRVITASALTAAVVAMVTVVVYEGRVKVASNGKTVIVEPGTTLEVRNPALEPPSVGGGPDLSAEIAAKKQELAELERKIEALRTGLRPSVQPARVPDPEPCDQVACVLNNNEPQCCLRFKKAPSPQPAIAACDAAALANKGDAQFGTGAYAAALASYEASTQCKADATILRKGAMAACRAKNAPKARALIAKLPESMRTGVTQICVREGIDPAACDADLLRTKGQDLLQNGMDTSALAKFEESLACKPDPALRRLAFMAACRSRNVESARRHYASLPTTTTQGILQVCVRNGIDEDMLTGADEPRGTLRIQSTPAAKVFLDGMPVGETPVLLRVVPGQHKITFQVGDQKWTYSAKVAAGKTESITKDLR